MPTPNNSIKFFYGDSSLYPPQSVDNDALYLIKNSGVYAGSNVIIDKSLFPINDNNTFLVKLYCNSIGNFEMDATGAELNDAINTNKTIIGEFDYSTIGNLQNQDIEVGGASVPNGILLCNISYSNLIEEGGNIKVYNIKLYNERCKFNISLNERTNVVSITGEIADQWSTTDTKVSAIAVSTDSAYPVLFKNGANNNNETTSVNFDSAGTTNFNYNPSTNTLTATNISSTSISASEIRLQGQSIAADFAKLASPAFTGTPTAPTASVGTDDTQIATTEFVNTAVDNLAKTQGVGYCTTAAATTAKIATLSNYSLYTGGIVSIWFQYDVPSSATLNINSKGAKQIRLRTTSSTSTQITAGVIKAGDTVTFIYDGQYYQLININSYTSSRLRYKLINSTNIASTTGLTNMEPDCVYVVGLGSAGTVPSWIAISSMKITSLKRTGYGETIIDKSTNPGDTCPFDGSFVPTYQIMFRATTSFSSIELPSSVRWKDNYAPDPNDMKDNYCELTIMNNIATMNIV